MEESAVSRRDILGKMAEGIPDYTRQKWFNKRPNLKEGDVVLMKDIQTRRNEWPLGVIMKAHPSKDGLVRKVEVKLSRQQVVKTMLRPTSEVVLLFSPEDKDL